MTDTRLAERAIRQRWPMSDQLKAGLVARLGRVLVDPTATARAATSAARALIGCEAQNQADEHHAAGDRVAVVHRIEVVEDPNWYGNQALLAAATAESSSPDPDQPGPDEAAGVREALGEDRVGDAGSVEGPRPDEGLP